MLAVQIGTGEAAATALAELRRHGDVSLVALPPGVDKSTVDSALSTVDGRRLVVLGDLAGLGTVVLRLLRRDRLRTVELAAIVDSPQWTDLVGLPRDPIAAARLA